MKKCTSFEEQTGTRYIRETLYFGIIIFSSLSSAKPCIRFLLNCFSRKINWINRSSHQRCSMKKSVLRNFAKFTTKHLCQSLYFNKVAPLRSATLLKKRLWHSCFPVNFTKFLRTTSLRNIFFLDNCSWIKGFYNSSLGNEVDFKDIMNFSPNILAKN